MEKRMVRKGSEPIIVIGFLGWASMLICGLAKVLSALCSRSAWLSKTSTSARATPWTSGTGGKISKPGPGSKAIPGDRRRQSGKSFTTWPDTGHSGCTW